MVRWALIRRVMIAAPSDCDELCAAAFHEIHKFNASTYLSREILEPASWRGNVTPSLNRDGAQAEIGKQLVSTSDILVAIFRHRLGTPTETDPSGVVQEIREHDESGRHVMVYFSNEEPPQQTDPKEFRHLGKHRAIYYGKGFMGEYDNPHEFAQTLQHDLRLHITQNPISLEEKIREAGNIHGSLRDDSPSYRFDKLKIDDEKVKLFCATFVLGEQSENQPIAWWKLYNKFLIKDPTNIPKQDIIDNMAHERDSFKFFLQLPNEPTERTYILSELASSDAVVTGEGSVDPEDDSYWQIWFLHPLGFIHPYMARTYLANHSLIDMSRL